MPSARGGSSLAVCGPFLQPWHEWDTFTEPTSFRSWATPALGPWDLAAGKLVRWGWDTAVDGAWGGEGWGWAGPGLGCGGDLDWFKLGEHTGSSSPRPPFFLPILPIWFLSSVLATGLTLSMGLLVTTAASGTSSSAPVEHGNFQAPLGRYLPVDYVMTLGLSARTKALGVPRVGGTEFGEGWMAFFSSNLISYFQRLEPQKFSERLLKAASLSTDLVSPSRLLSCLGWVSWLLLAQMVRCCCSVCPILRPCWHSSPQVSSPARRRRLL